MTRGQCVLAAVCVLGGMGIAHGAVVTRGPYLQTPTSAAMTVRWRTDVATDSRVRFGPAPGSLTQTADNPVVTTDHVIRVTGLAPDQLYYYSVGDTAAALVGDDADHFFRTAPVTGSARPMRIWVTGDGGFANANGMAVRDAYAAFNAGGPTDMWLLLGDNAYVLGTDADYQAALFDMHHDMLRSVPVYSTFGNHEAFSSNSLIQTGPYFDMFSLPRVGEAGGVASGTEAYYSFDWANVHFIVLDSEANVPTGPGSPMLVWLEADLQATTADWVVAFWHRPPYSKGLLHDSDVEGNEINMRTWVVPLLEDYGVDLVLCGHSHSYERSWLLDGHYGFSGTFTAAHKVEPGDGDPGGDGAYRKPTLGPAPHEGAVYVVAGSSSEVRTTTLDHPAMLVGRLELGSVVLDVDGDTLTARFLNSLVQTTDTFRIVKGDACPPVPRTGCAPGAAGRLVLRQGSTDARDQLSWRWRAASLDPLDLGAPAGETDVAVCVYDQDGVMAGGSLLHGTPGWTSLGGGLLYLDSSASHRGIGMIKVRPATSVLRAQVLVKGRGAALGIPTLPASPPLTAQLVNLDTGACWESVYTTPRRNAADRVVATLP
jgi:hypothetical protein